MSKNDQNKNNKNFYDYYYQFPLKNHINPVEIPNAFLGDFEQNSNGNKLYSYIKIGDTPTLCLDISNESNVNKHFLSSANDKLKSENSQKEKKIEDIETSITSTKNENENLKKEIARMREEILLQQNKITQLNETVKENEEKYQKNISDILQKLNEKSTIMKKMKENYEKIQKQIEKKEDIDSELFINKATEQLKQLNLEYLNSSAFLLNKFSDETYSEAYIKKTLQNDLLDFQEYVKGKIKFIKPKITELIELFQTSVNESIGPEYEVKLYGSHATNLCLPWSDLDVVIARKENNIINSYTPLHDLYKYLIEKDYFQNINFIGTATIPLIKIQTKENFNCMSVDISLQDNKHYGIKCVSLVNSFITEYEVLTPMVLALKNILKQASLNDPYKGGLSSYGLILLLVYFLKNQIEQGKPITKEDGNLGRLFFEFLYFYGIQFDPNKSMISVKESYPQIQFFENSFFPHQSELIIIDPLNHSNNVGKNTRQYNKIKLAFMIGFLTSKEACECGCHFQGNSSVSPCNTEHCILKRIFNGVKRFTPDIVS